MAGNLTSLRNATSGFDAYRAGLSAPYIWQGSIFLHWPRASLRSACETTLAFNSFRGSGGFVHSEVFESFRSFQIRDRFAT